MQPPRHHRQRSLVLLVLAACCWSGPASAQDLPRPNLDFKKSGVRFEIKASVRADAASSELRQSYDQSTASVTVKLRISAHARESRFFGEISRDFSGFAIADGSAELPVWGEGRCHQRRGLPKVTVVAIDGTIATDKKQTRIEARPRQLGLLLPADEISQGTQLPISL